MRTIFTIAALVFVSWMVIVASCKKNPPLNKPPTAIAGPDQVITAPLNSVSLNGTASWDPDGKISEWLWTKISGPAHAFSNATAGATVVNNLVEGVYQLELKVTDDGGLFAKDTMQITVTQPNRPPVANAGPDIVRLCTETGFVTLNGTGSADPDGHPLFYQWTKILGPASSNLTNSTLVNARVSNLVVGQYVFELKVTDGGGLSSKDTMLLDIVPEYKEYNLDVIIDGSFTFEDNVKDCYYTPCSYYDLTTITGKFNFQPLGQFDFYTSEQSDTARAGNVQGGTHMSFYTSPGPGGPYVYGISSINFKQLFEKGGGLFNGTFEVDGGSASVCGQNVYPDLPPLTVTGNMDTTARTVKLNIKGKIYF